MFRLEYAERCIQGHCLLESQAAQRRLGIWNAEELFDSILGVHDPVERAVAQLHRPRLVTSWTGSKGTASEATEEE
jgi:hypothetical protein